MTLIAGNVGNSDRIKGQQRDWEKELSIGKTVNGKKRVCEKRQRGSGISEEK